MRVHSDAALCGQPQTHASICLALEEVADTLLDSLALIADTVCVFEPNVPTRILLGPVVEGRPVC